MASGYPPTDARPPPELLPCRWAPSPAWGWPSPRGPPPPPPPEPASSPESAAGSLSPAYAPLGRPRAKAPGGRRGRLGEGPRQSASQREKLRMRRLARALHTLRRFLPPSVAPAGQSLTKIETLRLTIRYIAHLSDLLGRGQALPAWGGAAPAPALALARRCPGLCPPGLGCCQSAASPPLAPPAAAIAPSPGPGAGPATEAAWLEASPGAAVGAHVEDPAGSSRAPGAAAEPSPGDFSAQGLPAELLAFLESFLPPDAQD